MSTWPELVCPRDHTQLSSAGGQLVCERGHAYPVHGGIPIFILPDEAQTHFEAERALDPQTIARQLLTDDGHTPPATEIHPLVRDALGAGGIMFHRARHRFTSYPIPELRLPPGNGKTLLDIGCNWGRWCVAAAQLGYRAVGIDPSFGALIMARRVCRQLGVEAEFICADARYLPFPKGSFDVTYSYSVIQHFSKDNARIALQEMARVLKPDGSALVQMPNRYGLRCLYNQLRTLNAPEERFAVRYWSPGELLRAFGETIGPSRLTIDGFFGLGMEAKNAGNFPLPHRLMVRLSELLRRNRRLVPVADSLFVHSSARRY